MVGTRTSVNGDFSYIVSYHLDARSHSSNKKIILTMMLCKFKFNSNVQRPVSEVSVSTTNESPLWEHGQMFAGGWWVGGWQVCVSYHSNGGSATFLQSPDIPRDKRNIATSRAQQLRCTVLKNEQLISIRMLRCRIFIRCHTNHPSYLSYQHQKTISFKMPFCQLQWKSYSSLKLVCIRQCSFRHVQLFITPSFKDRRICKTFDLVSIPREFRMNETATLFALQLRSS